MDDVFSKLLQKVPMDRRWPVLDHMLQLTLKFSRMSLSHLPGIGHTLVCVHQFAQEDNIFGAPGWKLCRRFAGAIQVQQPITCTRADIPLFREIHDCCPDVVAGIIITGHLRRLRPAQYLQCTGFFQWVRAAQRMDQDKSMFSFPQVTVVILAITVRVADQIQDIILNLKRDTQRYGDACQLCYFAVGNPGNYATGDYRGNEGVPCGLLVDQAQFPQAVGTLRGSGAGTVAAED